MINEEAIRAALTALLTGLAEECILQELTDEQLKAMYDEEEERQNKLRERGGDAQEKLRCILCKRAIAKIIDDRRKYNGKSEKCCACAGKEQSVPGAGEAVGSDL